MANAAPLQILGPASEVKAAKLAAVQLDFIARCAQ
jgi:hypothetical protein